MGRERRTERGGPQKRESSRPDRGQPPRAQVGQELASHLGVDFWRGRCSVAGMRPLDRIPE